MSLKFGTSGLRGLSRELSGPPAARYALAFARHLLDKGLVRQGDVILIGRDFRESSPEIAALCAGALLQAGFHVADGGALPTPALAHFALQRGMAFLMVTGSHIPADRNGIKFYRPDGEIDKTDEIAIAAHADKLRDAASSAKGSGDDRMHEVSAAFSVRNCALLPRNSLQTLRVGVYQHSSVARDLFCEVIASYGAEIVPLGRSETFIPVDTEAVSLETIALLKNWSAEHRLDAIVSADGDGDRPLIADENGMTLRGDLVGMIASMFLGADKVVTPVTSNSGLEKALGCEIARTQVGSPFVIAAMTEALKAGSKAVVGFEANGGCLTGSDLTVNKQVFKALPTRDSFLPVLAALHLAASTKRPLSELAASYALPFALSGRLEDFPVETSARLMAHLRGTSQNLSAFLRPVGAVKSISDIDGLRVTLADARIVHLRPSGNAPEMRCYVEAPSEADAIELLAQGLRLIQGWASKH